MTTTIAILVQADFSPYHLTIPLTVFNSPLPESHNFKLKLCSEDREEVSTQNRFRILTDSSLEDMMNADIIIIPYWNRPDLLPSPKLVALLRQAFANGTTIVGLCLGVYVLAYADLLDGKKVTTHWAFKEDFLKRFPEVKIDHNALYVDEEQIITSAGTTAAMDCCLYIVRKYYGTAIANKIARYLVTPPHREGGQAQFIDTPIISATKNEQLNQLLADIRSNLTQAYKIEDLAHKVAMSKRNFSRKFQAATGTSPMQWIEWERLHKA